MGPGLRRGFLLRQARGGGGEGVALRSLRREAGAAAGGHRARPRIPQGWDSGSAGRGTSRQEGPGSRCVARGTARFPSIRPFNLASILHLKPSCEVGVILPVVHTGKLRPGGAVAGGLARQQFAEGGRGHARGLVGQHGRAVLGAQGQVRAGGAQAAQAGRAHVAAEVHVQRLQRAPVRRHGRQRAVGDARAVLQAQRAQARAAAQQAGQAVVGDVAAARQRDGRQVGAPVAHLEEEVVDKALVAAADGPVEGAPAPVLGARGWSASRWTGCGAPGPAGSCPCAARRASGSAAAARARAPRTRRAAAGRCWPGSSCCPCPGRRRGAAGTRG